MTIFKLLATFSTDPVTLDAKLRKSYVKHIFLEIAGILGRGFQGLPIRAYIQSLPERDSDPTLKHALQILKELVLNPKKVASRLSACDTAYQASETVLTGKLSASQRLYNLLVQDDKKDQGMTILTELFQVVGFLIQGTGLIFIRQPNNMSRDNAFLGLLDVYKKSPAYLKNVAELGHVMQNAFHRSPVGHRYVELVQRHVTNFCEQTGAKFPGKSAKILMPYGGPAADAQAIKSAFPTSRVISMDNMPHYELFCAPSDRAHLLNANASQEDTFKLAIRRIGDPDLVWFRSPVMNGTTQKEALERAIRCALKTAQIGTTFVISVQLEREEKHTDKLLEKLGLSYQKVTPQTDPSMHLLPKYQPDRCVYLFRPTGRWLRNACRSKPEDSIREAFNAISDKALLKKYLTEKSKSGPTALDYLRQRDFGQKLIDELNLA